MRIGLVTALLLVAGCAAEKLALTPPSGVDFGGTWTLNEADSDDPMRVAISQSANANATSAAGGQSTRGNGRSAQGGAAVAGALLGPVMPGVAAVSDGLRWPGKELYIKQVAGVVTIVSMGRQQVYRPTTGHHRSSAPPDSRGGRPEDTPARDRREGVAAQCGWDGKTLVVQADNPDDEHPPYEERYSLSDDAQRLIEVVAFNGGRSGGFTVSRVWDRAGGAASDARPRQ